MKTLTRDEMKKIIGGNAPASCGCLTDADCGNQITNAAHHKL